MEAVGLWRFSPRISRWSQLLTLRCSVIFYFSFSLKHGCCYWSPSFRAFSGSLWSCSSQELHGAAPALQLGLPLVAANGYQAGAARSLGLLLWFLLYIHSGNQAQKSWGLRLHHYSLQCLLCAPGPRIKVGAGYFLTS